MDISFYTAQMARLRTHFGTRNFSDEFTKLLWDIVREEHNNWFRGTVDSFIGELKTPPRIVNFREAVFALKKRIASSQNNYDSFLNTARTDGGWSKIQELFGQVKTAGEAIEILILKKKANKANGFDEYRGLEIFKPR